MAVADNGDVMVCVCVCICVRVALLQLERSGVYGTSHGEPQLQLG